MGANVAAAAEPCVAGEPVSPARGPTSEFAEQALGTVGLRQVAAEKPQHIGELVGRPFSLQVRFGESERTSEDRPPVKPGIVDGQRERSPRLRSEVPCPARIADRQRAVACVVEVAVEAGAAPAIEGGDGGEFGGADALGAGGSGCGYRGHFFHHSFRACR